MGNNQPPDDMNLPESQEDSAISYKQEPILVPSTQEMLSRFVQNPVDFIRQIITEEAGKHLSSLKEEAELRGALNVFRKNNPDFIRFEPLILQEVVMLIQNDPDGDINPWENLLEKATEKFKKKFQAMLDEGSLKPFVESNQPPFMEGANNRAVQEQLPAFSRTQIANMSMGEYLKNETAIDDALKGQRIV